MDLNFTEEELSFRDEVRQFVETALPVDLRRKVRLGKRLSKQEYVRWQEILNDHGWGAPMWPKEFGGTGWAALQRHIFDEECAHACAPLQMPMGLKMVAPVIMEFGSVAQQRRFLPRIVSGADWWCQGYSEPGAGSDLAALGTRAERVREADGEFYVVNGQKTWTSLAQYADWMFCLVRTGSEVRPQAGISFLLIDMKTPGITVRPIIMLDGEHEINEVWFDGVRVPVENRVGEENKGWTYAKFLLGHERTGIAGIGRSKAALARLKTIARDQKGDNGRPLMEDSRFRDRIAQLEMDLMALAITNLKVIAAEQGQQPPGPEASMLKLKGTEIQQALTELTMLALGPQALPWQADALADEYAGPVLGAEYAPPLAMQYFNNRKTSIYGGSNEIQKNIIARMILGLG